MTLFMFHVPGFGLMIWTRGVRLWVWRFTVSLSYDKPVLFSERYGHTKVYRFGCFALDVRDLGKEWL